MNQDIVSLLYRIKENISYIESNGASVPLLDEIQQDFLEFIELLKLFLISERDSYYGYFMMNMQFQADFYSNSIACIKLNTFPPLFSANPLLLCKFSLKEIIYIFCHEIEHVLLNHPAEMVKSNPKKDQDLFLKFNIAADASVNERLNDEIKKFNRNFMSMPEGVITSNTIKKDFKIKYVEKLENYLYYLNLIISKDIDDNDQQPNQMMTSQTDGASEQKSMNDEGQSSDSTNEDASETQEVVTANNAQAYADHQWDAGTDYEEATSVVRELINITASMMNEEARGMVPQSFFSMVEKINEPPVLSWQKILKKYVGTISASKVKTRMKLNRRQPHRFDLSGSKVEKELKIVIAIDTSGSITDELISSIFNEVFSILSKKKYEITVIECDCVVQRVYKITKPSDVKLDVLGRGGTEFTPVIKYINEHKYYRDALLIYFTDGYGENKIPKPRTYRNLWVLVDGSDYLSVKEPYGTVVKM